MENASEALKMAGFMLLFVVALTVAMTMLSKAKTTADSLIKNQDRQTKYQYVDTSTLAGVSDGGNRLVSLSEMIPTLYRYAKEKYAIRFVNEDGQPLAIEPEKADLNRYGINESLVSLRVLESADDKYKSDLDLDTETWEDASGNVKNEPWRGYPDLVKLHVDGVIRKLWDICSTTTYNKTDVFKEQIGLVEDTAAEAEEDPNGLSGSEVTDTNKQYKRIIVYTIYGYDK